MVLKPRTSTFGLLLAHSFLALILFQKILGVVSFQESGLLTHKLEIVKSCEKPRERKTLIPQIEVAYEPSPNFCARLAPKLCSPGGGVKLLERSPCEYVLSVGGEKELKIFLLFSPSSDVSSGRGGTNWIFYRRNATELRHEKDWDAALIFGPEDIFHSNLRLFSAVADATPALGVSQMLIKVLENFGVAPADEIKMYLARESMIGRLAPKYNENDSLSIELGGLDSQDHSM
jgi:hypothetical protein